MKTARIVHLRPILVPATLLLFALLPFIGSTGCVKLQKTTQTTTASLRPIGSFRLGLENRPARPVVGDNRLLIRIEDASGKPIAGARVDMMTVMQAMGAMPRMEGRGTVKENRPGMYEAAYGLSMQGEWDVEIAIRGSDGAEAVATYRLSTSTSQLTFVAGTPPPGAAEASTPADSSSKSGVEGLGAVLLDPGRRQEIGVRTAIIAMRPLRASIRAAGKVAYDETRRTDFSLKFSGWVRDIRVDYTGRPVRRGETLFTAYSPELLSAQQEYLEALRTAPEASADKPASLSTTQPDLAAAARRRLRLWDLSPAQLDAIAKSGKPMEAVPVAAPVTGFVLEKNVVQGSSFTAGQVLYKIASVHPVWVIASVYQYELPLVRPGMSANVEAPFLPERTRAGRVSYVAPYLDESTRTGEVRLTVPNPGGELKPGMFVDVRLERDLGTRLAVPASAVLYEGDRRVVFVEAGGGRILPREVVLGPQAGDVFAVERGLKAGDVVVTSGNFLIAAESKLKAAARR